MQLELPKQGKSEKNIFKDATAPNLPDMMKTSNPAIQQAQWIPCTENTKKTVPGHLITKLLKTSETGKS